MDRGGGGAGFPFLRECAARSRQGRPSTCAAPLSTGTCAPHVRNSRGSDSGGAPPAQMNNGTSSPLASSSESSGPVDSENARTVTTRVPSSRSPGWRPAQSSQPVPCSGRISTTRCWCIEFSLPPIRSIGISWGGMRDGFLLSGLALIVLPRRWYWCHLRDMGIAMCSHSRASGNLIRQPLEMRPRPTGFPLARE
jgi:hypothetical protein